MPCVDLVDETFIAAPAALLGEIVADPARWAKWWPGRRLEVFMDRGPKGQRWAIAGDLVGTAEIWIEAYRDGAVLHYYLRADPPGPDGAAAPSRRAGDRMRRREATGWKASAWALKHELETGRPPGTPAAPAA